ncbi:MAG TPA: Vms1/Ankzf1 family peptidyl-tRNA hydrolase [Solirubrobacteraceae bacterium]|nr:Vms1/Ankzf1 family peptidyl-tRNA hydrolase [Solirubrobacteraceae bacterium]
MSFYLDLDPDRFATPPARASQIGSLIDQAHRELEADQLLSHDERIALREDLRRIKDYLTSPQASFKGARALAVFASTADDLFETVKLSRPVEGRVVIDRMPYIEPMVTAFEERRWLVALVNRRSARLLEGSPDGLRENERVVDDVPGKGKGGGWSQANYERSVEADVEAHLRKVADEVNRRWREEEFDRLAIGGPQESVPRFEELLAEEVRANASPCRVDIDISSATEAEVRAAVEKLVEADNARAEREALDRLQDGLGAGGRAAGGREDTVAALNERRVQTLLLEPGFDGTAYRCGNCGLLVLSATDECPADGSELEPVEHLGEAVVEAALVQDADVLVIRRYPDLGPLGGIGALLRF